MAETPTPRKVLHGGTFNLKFGRDPERVIREVETFVRARNLDFVCLQEATDYYNVLSDLPGYNYYARWAKGEEVDGDPGKNTGESGILVHERHQVSSVRYGAFGDGWITKVRGGHHPPPVFPRLTIDGWLRVGSVHLPTPSKWIDGRLFAPPERVDDYKAFAAAIRRFMKSPVHSRLIAGDWNEPPTTMGLDAPGEIAKDAKAKIACPESKAGHGHIDYAMFKRCEVYGITKDLQLHEESDHEAVYFVVRRK